MLLALAVVIVHALRSVDHAHFYEALVLSGFQQEI